MSSLAPGIEYCRRQIGAFSTVVTIEASLPANGEVKMSTYFYAEFNLFSECHNRWWMWKKSISGEKKGVVKGEEDEDSKKGTTRNLDGWLPDSFLNTLDWC